MNKSNLEHAMMAAVLQLALGLATGNWFYGIALAAGLFWGREHAQKQDNIADARGVKVKDLEWYEGANMKEWSQDSVMDFATPVVTTILIAIIALAI